ncbi:MAG: nucleoside-triphosphatase [Bacteroidales bacterium]
MNHSSDIWLKASVAGSLWAGNEIIVGSFLHNLHVPLSGMILSMVSVALMVGFLQVWRDKGLIWRAGLICALMKSVSPSAVIIGPMVGIFMEALLMEGSIVVFGRNWAGFIIGGIAGVLSTLVHKVVSLLLLYGFDFIRLIESMYLFAVGQLRFEQLEPVVALMILISVYTIFGIMSALFGVRAGMLFQRSGMGSGRAGNEDIKKGPIRWAPPKHRNNLFFIFLHILAMVLVLFLINRFPIYLGGGLAFLYIVFAILFYKQTVRYLSKPGFWMQILFMVLVASLFWEWVETGKMLSMEGLLTGIKMMIRALVIVVGFAAVSVELRSPVVRAIIVDRGYPQLYNSLELAFSILPSVVKHFVKPYRLLTRPVRSMAYILSMAEELYNEQKTAGKRTVTILEGGIDAGKTSYLKKYIRMARSKGIKVAGILSEKKYTGGAHMGYMIQNVGTGERRQLCTTGKHEGWPAVGRYYFNPEAFEAGIKWISGSAKQAGLIIIDEIGPLELKGRGWAPVLNRIEALGGKWLLVVREGLVTEVVNRFNLHDAQIKKLADVDVGGEVFTDVIQMSSG